MKTTKTKTPAHPPLPKGIIESDLVRPSYDKCDAYERDDDRYGDVLSFELWHSTGYGWAIPTLLISRASRRRPTGTADRTYAVAVGSERAKPGTVLRIGLGPHVTAQLRVYVKKTRRAALAPYLDLIQPGAARANEIRDRISSRRAQGALYRMTRGGGPWDL